MSRTTYDNGILRDLIKKVEELRSIKVEVGIFSDHAARTMSNDENRIDNPTLGALHEFGVGVPIRSWLRMPLGPRFAQRMNKLGSNAVMETLQWEGAEAVGEMVGEQAEAQIAEAFATQGFGTWKKWSPEYAAVERQLQRANSRVHGPLPAGTLLVQTGQMSRAVSSRVVSGGAA